MYSILYNNKCYLVTTRKDLGFFFNGGGNGGGGGGGGDVLIWRRPMAPIFRPDDD
jgi:hypothetical protein